MTQTPTQQILELAGQQGIFRLRDLKPYGIPHSYVQQLYEQGALMRMGRGMYTLADWDFSENCSFAEICRRVPAAVICLNSALRYHELGTQSPWQVWIAIGPKRRLPGVTFPPIRVMRFSGLALTEGVEEHLAREGPVRVYGAAKTIVDCFRYRNKVGLDVALEALRDGWRSRKVTMDELWHYAKMLRIASVMRPYLESVV